MWRSQRAVVGTPAKGATVTDTWSAPVVVGRFGPQGQYEILIFRNASAAPAKPTGGTFNVGTGALTTAPTGWSSSPSTPTGSDRAWASRATIDPNKVSGSVTPSWSDTYEAGGPWASWRRRARRRRRRRWRTDGEDGYGYEYVFAATDTDSIASSKLPDNAWTFDTPGTSDDLVWSDDAPNLSAAVPNLWRAQRVVSGTPTKGDAVTAEWTTPVVVGRFGKRGEAGADGVDGAAGQDGDDGLGFEFVFARTNTATIDDAKLPSNDWGFDSPATVDGLAWTDDAPSLTAALPTLWRSQRQVAGTPTQGASVSADWSAPVVVGRHGEKGAAGVDGADGTDGEDGYGFEYVFAVTDTATIATSKLPDNAWGFDSPATVDDLEWSDDAPTLTAALPNLWRAQRVVPGTPTKGDAVTATWSTPVVVGRYGEKGDTGATGAAGSDGTDGVDGSDGKDGDDGHGFEYVFARTNTTTIATSKRPKNTWGFDSPGTSDELVWTDDAPNLTAALPTLWRSQRSVPGTPSRGTTVTANWSSPVVVGRYGQRGATGQAGAKGVDGSDGDDGQGYEFVFTRTSTTTLASSRRPNNAWGYDSPGARGGQTWSDGAPTLTAAIHTLWRSQRAVPGTPVKGSAVTATWSVPVVVGRYGQRGAAGADGADGSDGDDGYGYEYVFARTNTTGIASGSRPDNAWGFDSPGTRGGVAWTDDAPALTAALPNLWRSQRVVTGTPANGATVTANWSAPVVVGRYGQKGDAGAAGQRGTDGNDGRDGAAGEDGTGFEFVYARTNTEAIASGSRPNNNWGFDSPGTRGGVAWTDDAPSLTDALPNLWRSQRAVPGAPSIGASVSASWETPRIIGRRGKDAAATDTLYRRLLRCRRILATGISSCGLGTTFRHLWGVELE